MATYWENSCSLGLQYVSWYKYLTVSLVFSHLGFWSGNLFLIAPFPDLCLLLPFYTTQTTSQFQNSSFCFYDVSSARLIINVENFIRQDTNRFPSKGIRQINHKTFIEISHEMKKPTICICENKDADQLRGNREADQRL